MTAKTIVMLFVAAGLLNGGDWYDQVWPEMNLFVSTSRHSRLFFLAAGTRTKQEGYSDGQAGVHADFYFSPLFKGRAGRHPDVARDKFLMIRAGYLFGKTPSGSSNPFTEHTALIEMTPRFVLPKQVLVSDRSRGDLRFLDGAFVPRYRNRLKIERSYPIGKRSLTPYSHAEAYYDWRYNVFHRFRYTAGGEFEINRRLILEAYYLRQQDSRSTVRTMNAIGLVLQVYLN